MNGLDGIPLWLAVPVAGLVMLGATLTLIGAWGFVRLQSFYDRLHAPTLASSWGTGGVILASALLASYQQERTIIHELVVGLGIMATVPVTLMLLGRAALHRDRIEGTMPQPGETPDSDPQTAGAKTEIETGVSATSDTIVHADPHQTGDADDAPDPDRASDPDPDPASDPVTAPAPGGSDGNPTGSRPPGARTDGPRRGDARRQDADPGHPEGASATPPADPPQERS